MQRRRVGGRPISKILILPLVAGSAFLLLGDRWSEAELPPDRVTVRPAVPYSVALASGEAAPSPLVPVDLVPYEHRIEPGDTVAGILMELGLDPGAAHAAGLALAEHLDVGYLYPGTPYLAFRRPPGAPEAGRLVGVRFAAEDRGRVDLKPAADGRWTARFTPYRESREIRVVRGTLDGALSSSISRAGGRGSVAYAMAEVLQWDLDFNRDLQQGDRFEVVYEDTYLDGAYAGLGHVLALTYEGGGRVLDAFRYGDEGYYDAEGRPLRKMFLRSPLRFSRITSRFSHRRFHPILKKYRPHYGVDYGAPTGTPVRVTASGVVVSVKRTRGGGNMVKVRHANGYLSAYLHLSKFAPGVVPGKRVRQGDVIGHVGNTGLSTAPHLDYRVQHEGRWIDPLTIESVPAEPIPAERFPEFEGLRDELLVALESGEPPAVLPSVTGAAPEALRIAAEGGDAAGAAGDTPETRLGR